MSEFSSWIKANALSIAIPAGSALIALVVAYGSFQRDNANLLNRLDAIEQQLDAYYYEIEELDENIDILERYIDNEIRALERELLETRP